MYLSLVDRFDLACNFPYLQPNGLALIVQIFWQYFSLLHWICLQGISCRDVGKSAVFVKIVTGRFSMGSLLKWLFILTLFVSLSPVNSHAGVSLPWSSTYNCSDWLSYSAALSCDGFEKNLSTTIGGHYEEITAAANYPGGAGGKGQRHWVGDGTNVNTGGTYLTFNSSQNNIWIRWYIRYQSGFKWSGGAPQYQKLIYFDDGAGKSYLGPYYDEFRLYAQGSQIMPVSTNGGWPAMYPSRVSDGSWHCMEIHINPSGTSNGVLQYWLDGQLKLDARNLNINSGAALRGFELMSNQYSPANGGYYYIDIDDIEISNSGYIGPISGSTPIATAPVNGVCGSSNGQSFTSLSSASPNLCLTGTVASFSGSGPWTWGCNGSGGGTSTSSTACSALLTSTTTSAPAPPDVLLFSESFENNSYASRGWYDNTSHGTIVSGGQSGNALQWSWGSAATTPTNGGSMRMQFAPTDSLYLSYYVKFQTGWRGSQKAYHPHMLYVLSDLDNAASAYSPLANNYLQTYVEFLSDVGSPYTIRPQLAIQDQKRVNTSSGTPPNNLTAVTENRSVAYCNTPVSAGATGTCYADNPYYSANTWKASTASISTNAWHHVEVYLKMNTISGGKGQANGLMQEWIDGVQVINRSDVLYRTAQDATKKWAQFVLAPYIGDGSPIAQSMWLDELKVSTSPPGTAAIIAPTGLQIKSIAP